MLCPNHEHLRRPASAALGICGECMMRADESINHALQQHKRLRLAQGLVGEIPKGGRAACAECGNHCRLGDRETGFCMLRQGVGADVVERYPGRAPVSWYFDPIPTNCTADWVCSVRCGNESAHRWRRGNNLAVFYGSCSSDCLFCQNSIFKDMMAAGRPLMTPEELADAVEPDTACVCYFGGDPGCNAAHSLVASGIIHDEWGIPICYETNGNISGKYLDGIADVVRRSRGTLKFDLKAVSPSLYRALTGVSNEIVLRNFSRLSVSARNRDRESLVASILLIPGYLGLAELGRIYRFIADCDPTVPTVLLGFFPHHHMSDLPRTSRKHAEAAKRVAAMNGLTSVRVGNQALLSEEDYDYQ